MMRVLAIETSGRSGSVALADGSRVVAEASFGQGLRHAAELLPTIDRLTREHGWTPASVTHVFVSVGPGSFTGLRVGVTLAKTIAMATGATLVAVPTARVLAANAPAEAREVVVVLDAKRGQIFTARFTREAAGDDWHEAEPARLDTPAAALATAGRPVYVIGEGVPYHADAIAAAGDGVVVSDSSCAVARAAALVPLGIAMTERGETADPFTLTPLYVRRPEPEEKRLAAEAAKSG